MTEYFFKAAAAALVTVVLVLLLKRESGSMAMLMVLAASLLLLLFAATVLEPVMAFFHQLADTAQIDQSYLMPVLKCTGIGILTQIVASVCKDAGESSLASMVELCGCVVALFVSLPLFSAVLQMITELIGAS